MNNNGMHTIRRAPNGGLKQERREDYELLKQRIQKDPKAVEWLEVHSDLWLKKA